FALLCSLIMVAAIVPAFATDATPVNSCNNTKYNCTSNLTKNNTVAVKLTSAQLAKLNLTQTKLNTLISKIDNLSATYKDNKKAKGLLVALAQYKKQAIKLNKQIDYFKAHPPKYKGKIVNKKANVAIKNFAFKTYVLNKKVALKAKILAKMSK
ncbi:MAG TPA: hypothetical protein VLR54_06440, partial [Methanobacteriaceae archaeon]|nr:hypothetical protein [Methanobacteriaceae archaeon]